MTQPIEAAAADAVAGTLVPRGGQALATLDGAAISELLAPYTVTLREWLTMLLSDQDFPEDKGDDMGIGVLAAILSAETSEEAMNALELRRAKGDLTDGTPGSRSPLLEIIGGRAVQSRFEEGAACYAIVDAIIVHSGERIRFSTGARAVQAVIVKHIAEGWVPFRGILTVRSHPTQRGFYPMNLEFGG